MSTRETNVNQQYKDRLFILIFGSEKKNIISFYNALNGSDYPEDADVEVTTIGNMLYMDMKNDVSFVLDSRMSLFEQQSTLNPNMPLRGLIYFGRLYSAYTKGKNLNIYGSRLIKVPTPQYYVLYNGKQDAPARFEQRLSDAFAKDSPEGKFEWTATCINLNRGMNDDLLGKCRPLGEYMYLVNCIRDNEADGMELFEAVDAAVVHCVERGVMKDFLVKHRSEVMEVVFTEFDRQKFIDMTKEDARIEGLEEGRTEGRAEGEARLSKLIQALFADQRTDLVQLVAVDEKAREEYYAKYNIM